MLGVHLAAIMATSKAIYPQEILDSWAYGLSAGGYALSMAEGEDFELAVTNIDRVIAFCGVKSGEIFALFVHPDFQGRGLGTALLQRGEQRAIAQHSGVEMFPLSATLSAVSFYERHGYRLKSRESVKSRGGMLMQVAKMEKPV